jgi:hypothetical protein
MSEIREFEYSYSDSDDDVPVIFDVVHDDDSDDDIGDLASIPDSLLPFLESESDDEVVYIGRKREREIQVVDESFIENKECECPLCLQHVITTQVVKLNCGHTLCITCHTKCENSPIENVANLCSVCRQPIKSLQFTM